MEAERFRIADVLGKQVDSTLRYSWADPVVGSIHLVARGSPQELAEIRALERAEYKLALIRLMERRHRNTFVHEWVHVLQAVAYPMLFLRTARVSRTLLEALHVIRDTRQQMDLPLFLIQDERHRQSQMIESIPIRLTFETRNVAMGIASSPRVRGALSEKDLLEEDASIATYRIDVGGRGNGVSYRRWSRETQAYGRAFALLGSQMSDDTAFRLLPIFVGVAFRTTHPMTAFVHCLAAAVANPGWLSDDMPDQDIDRLLHDVVLDRMGEADAPSSSVHNPAVDDLPGVIPSARFDELIDSYPHLPLTVLARWSREDRNGEVGSRFADDALTEPWRYIGRTAEYADPRMARYLPPATIIEFDAEDFRVGESVLIVSPALDQLAPPGADGYTYRDVIWEALRIRRVASALIGERKPRDPCPHTACYVHRSNLCQGWIPIPSAPEDCEFPKFWEITTEHRIHESGRFTEPIGAGTDA